MLLSGSIILFVLLFSTIRSGAAEYNEPIDGSFSKCMYIAGDPHLISTLLCYDFENFEQIQGEISIFEKKMLNS